MGLHVFVGESGVGKTTEIIKYLRKAHKAGRRISLYLSDDPFLSNRPNVKPGGKMGCRTAGLHVPITAVLNTNTLRERLAGHTSGDVVAVDEGQYFGEEIVDALADAKGRGVDVVIGMPSPTQLERLMAAGATVISPNHTDAMAEFAEMLERNAPYPNERHAYQPLFGVNLDDFKYVREDCPQRLNLMLSAARKQLNFTTDAPAGKTYVDVGCCSGYFCEGMAAAGFESTGVDVQQIFIDMGKKLSDFRGSGVTYIKQNAYDFSKRGEHYDIISSFATIQWVMTQRGYDEGLETLVCLMDRANEMFVLEMGYTSEDIYKGKISVEIDRQWTENVLRNEGRFANVKGYWQGQNGLWRDVFIATR